MITVPRFNDPNYILNKINEEDAKFASHSLDVEQVSGPKFYYPSCEDNCLINKISTIPGANYILEDGRCFKSIMSCDKYDCLEKIVTPFNKDPSIHGNFSSCTPSFDTRIQGIRARYIRLERGTSIHPVSINSIEAYDIFGSYIPTVIGRAYPVDGENYGINLLNNSFYKIAKTLNVDGAYVQIDLGREYTIYMVKIINVEPFDNIYGNNLVMIKENKNISLRYPINFVYNIYYITTKFDTKYIPNNEYISFEPYKYPSCISEGCIKDGTILDGYKYMFDKPIPTSITDLFIQSDSRCFNTLLPCSNNCLEQIITNKFNENDINYYFTSCEDNTNTLIPKISAKHIILQRTYGNDAVELSELEVFNDTSKYIFTSIKSYPYDPLYPPERLIDNDYMAITKTKNQSDAKIQGQLPDDETIITHIYLSIPTIDENNIIGTTLYIIDNNSYIIHDFTFTIDNINLVKRVFRATNVTTFELSTNGTGSFVGTQKDISDVFDYPSCDDCIIDGNQIIDSIYKLPDGRCVRAITDCAETSCLSKLMNNTLSILEIEKNYQSCSDTYDTRYLPVYGRYVLIQREDSLNGFDLSEISIFDQLGELSIVNSTSYPMQSIDEFLLSPEYAYDKSSTTYASVKTSITTQKPFMKFDLGSNKMIMNIKLLPLNESLNGTKIYILSDSDDIVYSGDIVGSLPGSTLVIIPGPTDTVDIPSTDVVYIYPACIIDGCTSKGHFIDSSQYKDPTKDTCVVAISEDPSCLTNYGQLYGSAMDACFESCDSTIDTRYEPSIGRFVRIRNTSGSTMIISEIDAINNSGIVYPIMHAFSKGVTDINERSDGIITKIYNTSVSGIESYVQIDLGEDSIIYNVKINGTIGLCVIEIINEMGMVVSSNTVTGPGTYSTRMNIYPIIANPVLEESFDYPSCSEAISFKDCVDINGNPKPFFRYNTVTGSCGVSKIACTGCLSKLSDGSLSQTEADLNFKSCSLVTDTRYPSLRGRYIRLQSTGLPFKLMKIEAFDDDNSTIPLDVIDTIAYPSDTNSYNLVLGTSVTNVLAKIDSIDPFAQLDLGMDLIIRRVDIQEVTGDTSLSSVTLYIINNNGVTVFQKLLSPFNNINYIATFPGIYTPQTISNSFIYPSCNTLGCTTSGHQVLEQQYNIGTRCFKAINTSNEPNCLARATRIYGAEMDACFDKCGSEDTRYDVAVGKYIRITRNISAEMKISEIIATKPDSTIIPVYSTYALGCTDILHRSDKINMIGNYVSVSGVDSFIQTEFATENIIKNITISVPSGNTFNNLVGSTIQVLNNLGNVVYEYVIDLSTPQLSDISKTFEIRMNVDGTKILTISATYNYPTCATSATDFECVTESNLSKPNFTYNLSQNRCAIALNKCTTSNCMDKLNANTLTTSEMDVDFTTCQTGIETRYPPIIGRYIRIERGPLTNDGFTIKGVEAYDINKLNASYTRSFPLSGINYSQYMKDSNDLSPSTTVGPAINDASGSLIKPFVQLDYTSDIKIKKIIITTDTGDNSLDGTILKIINDSGDTVYQKDIILTSGIVSYTFYINDFPELTKVNSNLVNTFNYNTCIPEGCIDESSQIDKQIYHTIDGRCLRAKGYQPVNQCLDIVNTLNGSYMDACFDSCSIGLDTRYPVLFGRFVRIRQSGSRTSDIKLYKIMTYIIDSSGTSISNNIITKHCKPIISRDLRSDNLNTTRIDPAGATGLNAYIQIDLGSDTRIDTVSLKWAGSIIGTELIIITQSGLVTHSTYLTDPLYGSSNEKEFLIGVNISNPTEFINISETYIYPATKNVYDGGLDENNKPKILYRYNLDNNLSVIVKSTCVTNDCLSFVNNNTMTLADMNIYFDSTSITSDTRFPNPIGRYIRIQRTDGTRNGFDFTSITFTGDTGTLSSISTLVYPKISTFETERIIATPLTNEPGSPFIQFDFGVEEKIKFINIITSTTSLRGTIMYIINSNGATILQKNLDNIIIGNNDMEMLIYPEITINNVPMSYKFSYDACKVKGCISSDSKHYDNQMYTLVDGRCFKAINNQSIVSCLDNIDNLTGATMDACFNTCISGIETRYAALVGRFVRLRQLGSKTTDIKLFKLLASGVRSDGTIGILDTVTKHCKPIISTQFRSDNLNTTRVEPAGATGANAYIQIDLGDDMRIDTIILNWLNSINGTELIIISQAGFIKYSTILTTSAYNTSGEIILPVNLNVVTTEFINISEIYNYPATKNVYDGGLDENNKPKLLYQYNLDNNLSVIVKSTCVTNDCLSFVNNNTMTLADMNIYFDSTSATSDTRFPNPIARYIRIQRTDGSRNGFGFTSIAFTGDTTLTSLHTIVYPKVSTFETSNITGTIGTDEPGYPFMQFDFGAPDKRMQFVSITTTDTSLNGTTLYVIDSNGSTITQKNITGIITGINSIELLKIYGEILTNPPMSYKFSIDTCRPIGCTPDSMHYENQRYISSDLRCFKAKGYQPLTTCLDNINTLYGSTMDACFDSCSIGTETRYPSLVARFVRLRQTSGRISDIKLFKLIANGPLSDGSIGPLPYITKHCKPIISRDLRSDNLNTTRIDPAGATGLNAYIQIDLGSDTRIDYITLKRSGSINNTELVIITELGVIKHITPIADALFSSSDEIVLPVNLNIPSSTENVTIIETYNYPATKVIYDGGLDEFDKPKILYRYILDNGLSVIPISLCVDTDCLLQVYNNTMTLPIMNNLFMSTDLTSDTRFPNPIGRYIHIQRTDGTKNGFSITNIEVKGSATDVWTPVNKMVYPLLSTFTTDAISGTLTTFEPETPFVQLDLGTEKKIKFIKITTVNNSLNGTTLYVIDSTNKTVMQLQLTSIISGDNNLEILKIPGTVSDVPMVYKFKYDECKTKGCITYDNKQYDNQMYEMSDLRCFKAIGPQSTATCLDLAKNVGGLYGNNMDACFNSCYTTYDSRYPTPSGRFIRLSRVVGTTNISLVSLKAYQPGSGTPTIITPLTAHVKNPISIDSRGDKLIDTAPNTIAISNSSGYLQLDLGSNTSIKQIELISPGADSNALIGTKLQIIKEDGSIIHETIFTASNNNYSSNSIIINTAENLDGSIKAIITEEFTWPCEVSDCIGPNGRTKPFFKYNIIDGRCLLAKDTGVDNIIPQIMDYSMNNTNEISSHFDSCSTSYLTQFTSIIGRYVRIRRINGTTGPISIANLIIKDKMGTVWTTPTLKTYVKPLKTIAADTYSYGKYLVDSNLTTFTVTDTISSTTPLDSTLDRGYVQIDLGQDKEIASIELSHNGDSASAETLNNTELIVVTNSGTVSYRQPVPIANSQRVIIVQNMPVSTGYTFTNSEIFNYPGCKPQGCITETNNLIKDFRYISSDNRCFKAKDDITPSTRLTSAIDRDGTIDINTYFVSCSDTIETRFLPAVCRYIRIERTDNKPIQLSRFEAYDDSFNFISPYDIHVMPALSSMLSKYELLKIINSTTDISSDISQTTYIQLDLGSDLTISEIIVNPVSTDTNGNNYLVGAILYLIKQDGTITYQTILTSLNLITSTFVVS